MNIPTAIKEILVHNHWDEFNFQMMQDCYIDKLRQSYSKFDYPLNERIISKIALFYNMKLKLNKSDILYFDFKKIKKYGPEAMQKQALKLKVNKVIYLADIHPGYLTVWLDEQERVWVDYDNHIYYYGSDIFRGIQNIVSGNIIETIKSVSNDER
ncbi:hypothetical protein LK442_02800 [Phocaeicola coprocola DSM 17136]|uniref:Uncharacterized protein n=1 Tax=Phocaeicola coprocola DSM 17136 TaxID=470145 RepID=B3JGS4_9BACT|nr:hypothetical protein [Phocaeicola coprocola]EDV01856.1 hypothetical protein BACCOP_01080 [Phocaeicola coprocola DSM 17136]MCC3347042.1 hypothetical protein [Phocaeicola coprocola DSM 17136]